MRQCASCQTTRLVAWKVMRNDDVYDCVSVCFIMQSHVKALILPFRPCMMMLSIERVTSSWRFFYKLHVLWDVDSYWKSCRAKKQTTNMAILRIKQSICWCRTWNIHIYEFILVLLGNLTEFKNKQFSLTPYIIMNGSIYICGLKPTFEAYCPISEWRQIHVSFGRQITTGFERSIWWFLKSLVLFEEYV